MYNDLYINEIKSYSKKLNLKFLENKSICITGGTGLILSYLIDAILETNTNVELILLSRSKEKAYQRFSKHKFDKRLIIHECDITKHIDLAKNINYILSGASFTDPYNYANYPVETITTNVLANQNLFELAKKQTNFNKFLVFSSCEVYGECTDILTEETKGIVNCLDVRSCYNESKRLVETMAIAYSKEYNINSVIARLSRVYGPTMKLTDTKALSQFMLNGIHGRDIVLKSTGEQKFSYCYVSDAVDAIFCLLEFGEDKNAYNITNDTETLMLKEIAQLIADLQNVNLKFELPSEKEKSGYSRAMYAIQDCSKIKNLNWLPTIDLKSGIKKAIDCLTERIKKNAI